MLASAGGAFAAPCGAPVSAAASARSTASPSVDPVRGAAASCRRRDGQRAWLLLEPLSKPRVGPIAWTGQHHPRWQPFRRPAPSTKPQPPAWSDIAPLPCARLAPPRPVLGRASGRCCRLSASGMDSNVATPRPMAASQLPRLCACMPICRVAHSNCRPCFGALGALAGPGGHEPAPPHLAPLPGQWQPERGRGNGLPAWQYTRNTLCDG